jgi:hypothetical protein
MQVQHCTERNRRKWVCRIVIAADVKLVAVIVLHDVYLLGERVSRTIGCMAYLYPVMGCMDFFKAKFTAVHCF